MPIVILETLITRNPALAPQHGNILNAFMLMRDCYRAGGKLLVAGNGGSAADAEHIVGELMKGFMKRREIDDAFAEKLISIDESRGRTLAEQLQGALPAISLSCHTSLNTAFANDINPDLVFAQQVYGYGKSGDVFLAISTSGNSRNILYAAVAAKAMDISVIGLIGADGGTLRGMSDIAVCVPAAETYAVQELHMPVYHCWCAMLEDVLF